MYFRMLQDPDTGQVTYLLADLECREAVVIDPRSEDLGLLQAMLDEHDLHLKHVLHTHVHALPAAPLRLLGHWPPARALPDLREGQVLVFGGEHLTVLETPGHTVHCRSYLWRDRLFCGGLLAPQDCPVEPQVAAPAALWDSVVRKVFVLPAETLLFSGHAAGRWLVSTVMTQRKQHPWFAGVCRDDFLTLVST